MSERYHRRENGIWFDEDSEFNEKDIVSINVSNDNCVEVRLTDGRTICPDFTCHANAEDAKRAMQWWKEAFDWHEPDDSPMTAVEVLEWFHKNYENADVMKECFNYDFSNALIFMLNYLSEKDVVDKITAYEAEKKSKPVEVEYGWNYEISKIDGGSE